MSQREKVTYQVYGTGVPKSLEGLTDEEIKKYTKTMPAPKPPKVSVEEMDKNNVPLYLRDRCVHRVMPLNNCRHENLYAPWACEEERLRYERCQFKQYLRHVRKSERLWKKEEKLRLIQQQIAVAKAREGPSTEAQDDE